jgi:hypothetical protein
MGRKKHGSQERAGSDAKQENDSVEREAARATILGVRIDVLALVVTVVGVYITWLQLQQGRKTAPTPSPTATQTQSIGSDWTPTYTFTPSATSSPAALPAYTPTLPLPTFIPITPTPSLQLPFEDNFDHGWDPNWKPQAGVWRIVNNQMTADPSTEYNIVLVGDDNWDNYIVDVDVYKYDVNAGSPVGVIVRARQGSYLIYRMNCCETEWVLISNGSENVIARLNKGIMMDPLESSAHHFRVEVNGQTYTGSIDHSLYLTVTDPTLSGGKVGLAFQHQHDNTFRFDNFKVFSPE